MEVRRILFSVSGVWANRLIPKGQRFGPFAGEKKKRSQVTSNVYMWEVGSADSSLCAGGGTGTGKGQPCLLLSPRFISQLEVGCAWTPQMP